MVDFFKLIDSPQTSPSAFSTLIDQHLPGDKINDLAPVTLNAIQTNCSVLFYACIKGKLNLVQTISLRKELRLDGPQDSHTKYSPLRGAYMALEVEIVAQLILLGVSDELLSLDEALDQSIDIEMNPEKEKQEKLLYILLDCHRELSLMGVSVLYPGLIQYANQRTKLMYTSSESNTIVWKWYNSDRKCFTDYDKDSSQKIEEAFKKSPQSTLELNPTYKIDISKMLQFNVKSGTSRKIIRETSPVVSVVPNRKSISSLLQSQSGSKLQLDEYLKARGKKRVPTQIQPQWMYEASKNNFQLYSEKMQDILETGYRNGTTIMETTDIVPGNTHIINFTTMEQINKRSKNSVKILREEMSILSSLNTALETILRRTNRLKEDEKIAPILEQYFKEPDCQTSYILSAVADKFNFHVVVLLCCSDKMEEKKFYVRDNANLGLAYLYLSYDGCQYDAILDNETVPEPKVTPEQLFRAIIEKKSADHFAILLSNMDPSEINVFVKGQYRECSLLYLTAREGRTDLVTLLVNVPGIKLDGPQDIQSQSSPLHVASWYFHVGIIATLLYKGANPRNPEVNNSKEPSNKCGTHDPQGVAPKIAEVWKCYHNNDIQGIGKILQEINSTSPPSETGPIPTNLSTSLPPSIPTSLSTTSLASITGSVVTLDDLCITLDQEKLPPGWKNILNQFKSQNLTNSKINEMSAKLNMTPLYIACRHGHFDVVKELSKFPEIKLQGIQMCAIKGRHGNTPLHVAAFRGHYRIVAFLLEKNVPQENNRREDGLPGPRPSEDKIMDDLDPRIRNIIPALFQIDTSFELQRKLKIFRTCQEVMLPSLQAKSTMEMLIKKDDELPLTYTTFDYIFYETKGQELVLFDLPITSVLNVEYKKYLYDVNPHPKQVEVTHLSPPSWNRTKWLVNFQTQVASLPGQEKKFLVVKRPPSWYYQVPSGVWLRLPHLTNVTIAQANNVEVEFITKEKGMLPIWTKQYVWNLNTVTKVLTMRSPGGSLTTYRACNEEDMKILCYWDPSSIKLTGRGVNPLDNAPWDEATRIQLDENHDDWQMVQNYFHATVPMKNDLGEPINKIKKIYKIIHPKNRRLFETRLNEVRQNHISENLAWTTIEYTKLLWHGTGKTNPSVLYSSPGAWNVAYASVDNLWGKGLYFASAANYSSAYAYRNSDGNKMLLLAQVRVGEGLTCLENKKIVKEPPGFDSIIGLRKYESIHGTTPMSVNYVVYDNAIALPVYMVEWREGPAKATFVF